MIKPINTNPVLLQMPCMPATPADAQVGQDLLDTLAAHAHECVGMGANMIGMQKRIIVVNDNGTNCLMYNPVIVEKTGAYETEEGCLSLSGVRPCTRYERIVLEYEDEQFVHQRKAFEGFTAQIIQHEVDHCNGVLI